MQRLYTVTVCLFFLSVSQLSFAQTLLYSFNKNNQYNYCTYRVTGGPNCVSRSCALLSNLNQENGQVGVPPTCLDIRFANLVETDQYSREMQESKTRLSTLENQVATYRQQIAQSQLILSQTIVKDPQFLSILAKKIKTLGVE